MAVRIASRKLNRIGSSHSVEIASCHQRRVKPTGGKRDRLASLNDTAAVTKIGLKMKR